MRVRVNGEARELPDEVTLAAALAELGLPAARVAVELNREIVHREEFANLHLAEGDVLEIVRIVGGG